MVEGSSGWGSIAWGAAGGLVMLPIIPGFWSNVDELLNKLIFWWGCNGFESSWGKIWREFIRSFFWNSPIGERFGRESQTIWMSKDSLDMQNNRTFLPSKISTVHRLCGHNSQIYMYMLKPYEHFCWKKWHNCWYAELMMSLVSQRSICSCHLKVCMKVIIN